MLLQSILSHVRSCLAHSSPTAQQMNAAELEEAGVSAKTSAKATDDDQKHSHPGGMMNHMDDHHAREEMQDWTPDSTTILTSGEITTVVEYAKRKGFRKHPNRRMNLIIFRLATCCGLRTSEIAGIRIGDVKVDTGISRPHLSLPAEICKGKKARCVPLWWDEGTLNDIDAWKKERLFDHQAKAEDTLLCHLSGDETGKPLSRFRVRDRFLTVCGVLGLERKQTLTVHHGRHSFVSHALAGGRSLAEVGDAAGMRTFDLTSLKKK